MRPAAFAHRLPERLDVELREIGLDQEIADVVAAVAQRARQVVMIGEVELAVRPERGGDRPRLQELAPFAVPHRLQTLALVVDLDHADGDLRRSQLGDLAFVQFGHRGIPPVRTIGVAARFQAVYSGGGASGARGTSFIQRLRTARSKRPPSISTIAPMTAAIATGTY